MVYTNHLYPFMVKCGMVYYCFPHIMLDSTTQKTAHPLTGPLFWRPNSNAITLAIACCLGKPLLEKAVTDVVCVSLPM
jgi:hypothetical protein